MTNQLAELLQQGLAILLQILLLGIVTGLLWIRKQLTAYIKSHSTVQERAFLERVGKEAFAFNNRHKTRQHSFSNDRWREQKRCKAAFDNSGYNE